MALNRSINIIHFTLISLCFGSCIPKNEKESKNNRPNVVFILTDDQGWGDLSINGNQQISTPNIDALAINGATFQNFYVSPVCSPTRSEILTGRFNPRSGVYSTSAGGERIDLDETTIADILQSNGYATAAFGKWHSGMQYPYHPNARGFDEYYGFCSGHWGHYYSPMLEHNGELVKGNGFLPDDLTNRAMGFIESHKDDPFFVYLPYNTPHSPMQVPDKYWNKFQNLELEQRGTNYEKENLNHTRAALAMCENIDWNVGRLMDKLDELALTENTIVIYLSDNGPNGHRWNGNMRGTKGSTDEGGVRSPLFIQWKNKIKAGLQIEKIASSIDFLPTLTALSDIDNIQTKPIDGKSLAPLLFGSNKDWEDRFVYNYFRNQLSIRSQDYRLDNDNRLYDMVNDQSQTTDVSADLPEIKKRHLAAKEYYNKTVLSELPKVDSRPFLIGHPDFKNTQIPARDGIAHGNIKRSNRWPNCSFFTNWIDVKDSITWDVEVAQEGDFDIILYYTCAQQNVGTDISLSFRNQQIEKKITEAHDPPLIGMEEDRGDLRAESYVKDFKPIDMGKIHLTKGKGKLVLSTSNIPGEASIDFRLLMLKRVS